MDPRKLPSEQSSGNGRAAKPRRKLTVDEVLAKIRELGLRDALGIRRNDPGGPG